MFNPFNSIADLSAPTKLYILDITLYSGMQVCMIAPTNLSQKDFVIDFVSTIFDKFNKTPRVFVGHSMLYSDKLFNALLAYFVDYKYTSKHYTFTNCFYVPLKDIIDAVDTFALSGKFEGKYVPQNDSDNYLPF